MSFSKPIWNDVHVCTYKSPNKSFGAKDTCEINHKVGSSAKNSHEFGDTLITKRHYADHSKYGKCIIFRHSVDGVVLKYAVFKDNNGRAGELIKMKSKLNRIKDLTI